jgi:hypothetical protein
MLKRIRMTAVLTGLFALAVGCDLVTDPDPLEEFHWGPVENGAELTEGMDAVGVFGEIQMLGQIRTPTLCYGLEPDFERDGHKLTLRVTAESTDAPNCAEEPGGFRYTGVLRHLDGGTYEFRAIHIVPELGTQEFTVNITL